MTLHFSLFGYGVSLQLSKKVAFPIDRLGPKIRRTSIQKNSAESERSQPGAQESDEKRLSQVLNAGH